MEANDAILEMIHTHLSVCVESWYISDDMSELEFDHMGEATDAPNAVTSYLVTINSIEIGFKYMLKFSKLNTVEKWIFIFKNANISRVEDFFVKAWSDYKMLNLLGILQTDDDFEFIIFNPFIPKPIGTGRGVFYHFESSEWENANFIIKNRLRNLHGYSIEVVNSGLPRFDYIPVYNSYGQLVRYTLMDGCIFTVLKTIMKFKPIFYQPSSFNDSQLVINKKISKVQNIIENDKVDISGIISVIQSLDTKNLLFLQNVDILKICYLVPKKIVEVNFIVSQFNIIDVPVQLLTIGTLIVLITFLIVSKYISSKMGRKSASIGYNIMIIWQIINSASVNNLNQQKNRFILLLVMLYSLVMCCLYQGILIDKLMQESRVNEINTLSDVDKSGLKIISTIPDVFKPSSPEEADENLLLYRLYKKHHYNPDIVSIMYRLMHDRNISTVLQIRHAQWIQILNNDKKTGKSVFHIVQEPALYFHRSFMVPKTSPYREIMNEAILYANEFGFYNLGHNEGELLLLNSIYDRVKAGFYNIETTVVITLDHIWPMCVVLGISYTVTIFVFLLEILVYSQYRRANATTTNENHSQFPFFYHTNCY